MDLHFFLGGGFCLVRVPSWQALEAIRASGSRHSFQAHHTAHVIDEVLQPDFCCRPLEADAAHDAPARCVLLGAEDVLDTRAHFVFCDWRLAAAC